MTHFRVNTKARSGRFASDTRDQSLDRNGLPALHLDVDPALIASAAVPFPACIDCTDVTLPTMRRSLGNRQVLGLQVLFTLAATASPTFADFVSIVLSNFASTVTDWSAAGAWANAIELHNKPTVSATGALTKRSTFRS